MWGQAIVSWTFPRSHRSQGSITLNWHSRYIGTRDSGTWLYYWHWCLGYCPVFFLSFFLHHKWVGVGGFSKVVATFNHVGGSFNFFFGHHRGCLNNPIFSNLGLCAACWAHFICHHELWPTSVSHAFSSLDSSLGFAWGKHYQKITIPIMRLVHQNFTIPGCFPYILF